MTLVDVYSISISCFFSPNCEEGVSSGPEWRVNSIEVENCDPIFDAKWIPLLIFSGIELDFDQEQNLHSLCLNGGRTGAGMKGINTAQHDHGTFQSLNRPLNRILNGDVAVS